jgi:hypothetical protein
MLTSAYGNIIGHSGDNNAKCMSEEVRCLDSNRVSQPTEEDGLGRVWPVGLASESGSMRNSRLSIRRVIIEQ